MADDKTKNATAIAAAAIALVLVYLFAAFVAWEANPASWSQDTRAVAALIGAWAASMAAAATKGFL